jgi:hypothetical protein
VTICKPSTREEIEATLQRGSKENWQLTVVILNNTPEQVYDFVKQCGNQRYGIVTQCVSYQALERNISKLDMCKCRRGWETESSSLRDASS